MADHPLATAVILAVGSELTTGSTRDTNSGELAAELSSLGVDVLWTQALPDDLTRVADAFARGLREADLVVSTGGLGPTPDDLTREAIAAATGRDPAVDPELESWLRALFRRRGTEMPATNLKQAWLVPGAAALRNGNGTAPGWWLEVDGRVVVALPGPPREMWPMWQAEVRPRLDRRGVGADLAHETMRLTGIGESALAELLGAELRRGQDPEVATYARADAVDVRVSSRGPGADQRVAAMVEQILPRLEAYAFGRGDDGWPEVIGRLLDGRTLATVEVGNGGQLIALLGEAGFVVRGEVRPAGPPAAELADETRRTAGADLGLALRAREGEVDIDVEIAIASADGVYGAERKAFLTGPEGHRRAALAACSELWRWLRVS
jgi:nicotinamide-nucleotide amidase